jgi:hypothetical protein
VRASLRASQRNQPARRSPTFYEGNGQFAWSAANLTSRIEPPRYLTTPERKLFAELVAATNVRHFTESNVPLLVSYVQATTLAQQAIKKAGKDAAALARWEKAVKVQATLATRLRLAHNKQVHGRNVRRVVTQKGAPSLTWWSMALGHVFCNARLCDLKSKLE